MFQFYSVPCSLIVTSGHHIIYTIYNSTPAPADRQLHKYDYQGVSDSFRRWR